MSVDVTGWTKIGSTSNADFYEISQGYLAVVPFEGCTDDERTATESVRLQLEYLKPRNQRAGVVIFMDGIAQQTAGARAVYRDKPDPAHQVCFALVGGTMFGRAVGSLFLGLSKPSVPTQMFRTLDRALEWCRSQRSKIA